MTLAWPGDERLGVKNEGSLKVKTKLKLMFWWKDIGSEVISGVGQGDILQVVSSSEIEKEGRKVDEGRKEGLVEAQRDKLYDSEENECGLAEVLYRKNTLKALVIALTKLPYKSQNAQKSGHARWLTCY